MSELYALFRNVRLVDPERGRTEGCDVLGVRRDRTSEILKIGKNIRTGGLERISVVNLHGLHACLPFTDLRCRIPDPGFPYRESLESGLDAACAGGFGRVLLMPAMKPAPETKNAVSAFLRRASDAGLCRAEIAAFQTKGGKGLAPSAYEELRNAGVAAICGDFEEKEPCAFPTVSAVRACAELGMLYIAPSVKKSVAEKGAVAAGRIASFLGVGGIDPLGELLAVREAIAVSEECACPVHIPLVTMKKSLELISAAKERGVRVTCATAAPYFAFNENELLLSGGRAKFSPPLRREEDRLAIIEGLSDRTIDCIVSDHTPLSKDEKSGGVARALPGAIGFETTLAAGITYLVLPGYLPLARLVELLSCAPAKLLGKECSVRVGGPLDLIFFDPEEEWVYSSNTLRSRSCNTPFLGMALRGRVASAIIGGVRKDYGEIGKN
ncbi:MAG: hypothetical protein IJU52_02815 [Clostridia bacterium]|nr:hypothetical protein [Clostridia bacterium]